MALEQELAIARTRRAANADVIALEKQVKDAALAETEAQKRAQTSAGRAIIDTSFTMDLGETVVVGTSRLQGDKALIVLLTAVPRKAVAK